MKLAPLSDLTSIPLQNLNACQNGSQISAWYNATLDNSQLGDKCLAMITNPQVGANRIDFFDCGTSMPVLCEANGQVVLNLQKSS